MNWINIQTSIRRLWLNSMAVSIFCIVLAYFENSFPVQLLSARDMAQRTVIGQDRIVYSTDRDLFDQDYEAQEWERKFQEIERSD